MPEEEKTQPRECRPASVRVLLSKARMKGRVAFFVFACLAGGAILLGDFVPVRYPEGVVRGFLVLRAPDGAVIADGDSIEFARGDRVTSRLVFHFHDGSLQDETTVFTQRGRFRLVSDRLVQRGPSFPGPMDVSIDAASGRVAVKYAEKGVEKFLDERMKLPPDLANGLPSTLLKNLPPEVASTTFPMLVAAPKPRLVKLVVSRAGSETISNGRQSYRTARFNIHVDLRGIAAAVAPIVGKQPKDASVWIVGGDAPGFARSQSQFFEGGPLWTIELAAPQYPR